MKAFLGMGLLGSNFVKAMLKKGDEVQVWNRTYSKAKQLEEFGAKSFENMADAVRGAEIVHLTLKDDAAVNEVLDKASAGFSPGTIIIDHTTTSKEGAIDRTKYWSDKGFPYQHAPVFMGPPNALESTGHMLISGDPVLAAKLQPHLSKMTGELINFGGEVGKAAAMKLIGNSFLVCFTGGIRDTLLLAKALGVANGEVINLFQSWNPGSSLAARLKRITSGEYSTPSWGLAMARKDTGIFLRSLETANLNASLLPVIAQVMDYWISKGHGEDDWSIIAKDAV
ncbi:MAG TPA: NAD(P)-dependent oxidoreductase [Chitinophagaceae bacterium]